MILVANLLVESDWAAAAARLHGRAAPRAPSDAIRARCAALGALFAAFADGDDTVWLEHAFDAERIAFWSGTLLAGSRIGGDVFWGALDAGAVADRAAWLDFATRNGAALPGSVVIRTPQALTAHLRDGGCDASPTGSWVVKARWSAAGRDRLRGAGLDIPDADAAHLARLLGVHGALLFEPWVQRTRDLGVVGVAAADGVRVVGAHEQETSAGGSVRAIRPLAEVPAPLDDMARRVGAELITRGFAGPFGVDAYEYTDDDGVPHLHALGEVNARHTLGHIAHRLTGSDPARALRLGNATEFAMRSHAARPLVVPGPPDGVAAWVDAD